MVRVHARHRDPPVAQVLRNATRPSGLDGTLRTIADSRNGWGTVMALAVTAAENDVLAWKKFNSGNAAGNVPLSYLLAAVEIEGWTLTKAAASARVSRPYSGVQMTKVTAVMSPTPGMLRRTPRRRAMSGVREHRRSRAAVSC